MKDDYVSRLLASVRLPGIALEELAQLPTEDVQPVRHGRWEMNNDGIMIWWECSECHHNAWYDRDDLYNYCPDCGAKMDKEG